MAQPDTEGWTLNALKEYFERIIKDLREWVNGRFTDAQREVDKALAAAKEAVKSAFESSEKAIVKAEEAQRAYNERSNEFRGQLDDQAKTLMPRNEAMQRFEAIDRAISELQRGESRGTGGEDVRQKMRQMTMWVIGLIVAAALSILGLVATLIYFLVGRR